jgi:serine/threonine protein kinase/Tol biopolymer transport system component
MTTIESGTILKARYKILDQLGAGGMGEVYLAEDQTLDNKVAVKANHTINPNATAQFIREARLLASLKQPNLPRVIDYFTEEDSQYLVMDFIPGENLRTLVENHTTFTMQQIVSWAVQLGNAVTYLHNQNPPIYHRDIKPANIKLTPAGEVVLVDFGIAKTGDPSQETQTGAWAFTPGFAPPEQVSGLRTGPYSDQFSLSATLYYLFAGKPPADSARRLMGEEELIPLNKLNPSIPAYISASIDKALAIKQDARFSTVSDFIAALTNPSPIPDPSSAQQTVIGRVKPVPPPVIPGAIPFVPPAEPIKPPKKKASPVWLVVGVLAVVGLLIGGYFGLKLLGIIGTVRPVATMPPTSTASLIVTLPPVIPTAEVTEALPTSEPTLEPLPTETTAPSITPIGGGGKVAFVSNRQADGFNQIWTMDVGLDQNGTPVASNYTQVTFSPGDKTKPSFSPDGTQLVFSGFSDGLSPNGTLLEADIWVLDLTKPGAEPIDISKKANNDLYPAWSPTGKLIAFTSYYREDKKPQIFVMKPDGSEQVRLSTEFAESYSSWTPNGNFLLYVFTLNDLNVLYTRDNFSLYKNFTAFDKSASEGRLGSVMEPNISLDGSMIVYTRRFVDNTDVYSAVYNDRGRTVTELTQTGHDYAPFWSADGKWIVFTSERDGDKEIYIMDPSGKNLTNLTNQVSIDFDPAWQPVVIP